MPSWSMAQLLNPWSSPPTSLTLWTGLVFISAPPSRFSIHSLHSDTSECASALGKHPVAFRALGSIPNCVVAFRIPPNLALIPCQRPPSWCCSAWFLLQASRLLFACAVPWALPRTPPPVSPQIITCWLHLFIFFFPQMSPLQRSVPSAPRQECLPW